MNWLAENSLPIWVGGGIALTMALIVYFQIRSRGSQLGVVVVLLITATLLLFNRLVETPREAVERTLYNLAATVEANDVPGVLKFIGPSATKGLKNDVETLMPLVRIERARVIGAPKTELSPAADSATTECRGLVMAVNKRDGMKGGAEDRFTLNWIRSGDHWLLQDYSSQKNWNRAVGQPSSAAPPR
jgi:hypothetical protein